MKESVFLLILFFIATSFFGAAAAGSTFKTDNKKSSSFNIDVAFERNKIKNNIQKFDKKINELLKKDPEKAKALNAQAEEIMELLKDARKFKDPKTAQLCGQIINSLKILALYHEGRKISDKYLYIAYNNYKSIDKSIKRVRMRLASAKRNSPQGKKISKFQRSAKNYLRKAKAAMERGYKAKAEYYNACAEIKKKAALNYAKNPGIETASKKQLRAARAKYNLEGSKESAVRFRKRAEDMRKQNNTAKAEYYEKVATLKDKLAEAYAENNFTLVKTLQKEYRKLQADSLSN